MDRGRRMAKAWGVGTSSCSPRSHTRGLSVRCRWRLTCHRVTPCLQTPLLQLPTPSHLPMEYPLPPAPALTQPPARLFLTTCSSPNLLDVLPTCSPNCSVQFSEGMAVSTLCLPKRFQGPRGRTSVFSFSGYAVAPGKGWMGPRWMGDIWPVADGQAAHQATERRCKIPDATWSWAAPSKLLERLLPYVRGNWPERGTRYLGECAPTGEDLRDWAANPRRCFTQERGHSRGVFNLLTQDSVGSCSSTRAWVTGRQRGNSAPVVGGRAVCL